MDVWSGDARSPSFGHARLAIVDLSEQGRQPMRSRSGRYVVVFNGEIYNHLELRQTLGRDLPWRGHSDTETLLEAIDQWGLEKALRQCVGMFALGLWDQHEHHLTLARDRMGEKPLYYGQGRDTLAFASELKALRMCPDLDFSLDDEAIEGYLQLGYVNGSRSAFRGVRKVPPGCWIRFESPTTHASPQQYWVLPEPCARKTDARGAQDDRAELDELERLLEQSVCGQMLADVPLGAFLSGGIDSSLIVATMQRCASQPIRTFSMGVNASEDDESRHAREVARHLGTSHTELIVSPQDVLDVVPQVPGIYDEPFADSSQIPTVLLSRLTRQHVTVALSGDAGDELFGGYNRHLTAARTASLMKWTPSVIRRALAGGLAAVPAPAWNRLSSASRTMGRPLPPGLDEKVARFSRFLGASDARTAYLRTLSQAVGVESTHALGDPLPMGSAQLDPAQRMMWWDMHSYLPDDILVKVDRAAMSASLETRVPFLDHRIVEHALATPLSFKIRQGRSKWILRELLARRVPRHMFERPKQGFTLPLAQWLRGPLRAWGEALIQQSAASDPIRARNIDVRSLWAEHQQGLRNHQRALWTLLMLQAWLNDLANTGSAALGPTSSRSTLEGTLA